MKWLRLIRKLKPYNIQKGLRYLKHYGVKEFLIRLSERMEPEEVPYGPWREQYCVKEEDLVRQRNHRFPAVLKSVSSFLLTVRRKFFSAR